MNPGKHFVTAVAIATVLVLALVCCGQVRTWTDAAGKYSVRAELVGTSGGKVELRRTDGRVSAIALKKLCAADHAYVRQQAASAAGKTPGMRTWTDAAGTTRSRRR